MAEERGVNLNNDAEAMREVLQNARTIAVVGHSDRPDRTSYQIAAFLRRQGYTVYPVNPTLERIGEERCYPTLRSLPETVDIVNVFRRSDIRAGQTVAIIGIGFLGAGVIMQTIGYFWIKRVIKIEV